MTKEQLAQLEHAKRTNQRITIFLGSVQDNKLSDTTLDRIYPSRETVERINREWFSYW